MKILWCTLLTLAIAGWATAGVTNDEKTAHSKHATTEKDVEKKPIATLSSDEHIMEVYSVTETNSNSITSRSDKK